MAKLNSGTRIYGNLQVDTFITASGNVVAASSQASTSTTTGALVVVGGVGIAGNINVTTGQYVDVSGGSGTRIARDAAANGLTLQTGGVSRMFVADSTGNVVVNSTTASASNVTGAVVIKGGLGISTGGINADGQVILANDFSAADPGNYDGRAFISMKNWTNISGTSYGASDPRVIDIGLGPSNRAFIRTAAAPLELACGNVFISTSKASTSTTTGALVVVGGAGIGGNINIGGSGGTAIVHTGNILPSSNLTANLGSPTAWYNTFYGVSTQAKYADLAENYVGDTDYAPGTVVVFGGAEEVTVTNMTHDTRVAGVVSTNPAYLMNAALGNVSVAMTGRVPCCVQGPVEKGTVLVSSHIPGVAEALNSSMYRPGCVLGKALEKIDSTDIKTIEVVVGRF